jgi:hypothetical protein
MDKEECAGCVELLRLQEAARLDALTRKLLGEQNKKLQTRVEEQNAYIRDLRGKLGLPGRSKRCATSAS